MDIYNLLKNYADEKNFNKTPIETFIKVILSNVVSKVIKIQEASEQWLWNDLPYVVYDFDKVIINTITRKDDDGFNK